MATVSDIVYGKKPFHKVYELIDLLRLPFWSNMSNLIIIVKRTRTTRELYQKYELHVDHPQRDRFLEQVKQIEGKALAILKSMYATL